MRGRVREGGLNPCTSVPPPPQPSPQGGGSQKEGGKSRVDESEMNETLHREYDAAIAGAGMVRLRNWSTVRAAGNDRATFLHNMCTNDVKRLTAREGC